MSTGKNYINLLPEELLSEIFTRVPAKSVGRCKCVSKPWASLISDPKFIEAHLTKTKHISGLTLISTETDPGILYSVHFLNDKKNVVNCDVFALKLNLKNCCNKWSKVWGSYDGLVLVQDIRRKKLLINPTTLESKQIPPVPCGYRLNSIFDLFGFGYDSSCDDYVVVAICYEFGSFSTYVYMLKTNQWNKVGFSPYEHVSPYDHVNVQTRAPGAAGIFLEGSLHWLAKKFDDRNSCLISAFNIAKKEFSQVPPPKGVFDYITRCPRLGVLKGCLCLTTGVFNRNELWVMREYGVVESWVKLSVFLTEDSSIVSLDFQEDGLFMLEGGRFVFLVSNAKEVILQDMKVIGLPQDFRLGMTFVDTLVSPNYIDYKKST
ncbi:F-box domain-containing protein [Heracleum sosnowskyi]|uniref:F-box domain-containing protein n=1 Tax=Heracleum sosnowskyi TaxID=360622 RepID=A0AAD8MCR4_9APIA|nr:F-box domain-containing protein [Heracleum sosnowskyi]